MTEDHNNKRGDFHGGVPAFQVVRRVRFGYAHVLCFGDRLFQVEPTLHPRKHHIGCCVEDPSKTQHPQALFSLFQLDVELLDPMRIRTQGSRVYIRFIHGNEAIAWRVLRSLRQFFLGQFRV